MSLAFAGFKPHRPGRIHILCIQCGRKVSNVDRSEYDPTGAVLMHLPCEKCSIGCKIDGPDLYMDKRGWLLDMQAWVVDKKERWQRPRKREPAPEGEKGKSRAQGR